MTAVSEVGADFRVRVVAFHRLADDDESSHPERDEEDSAERDPTG
jgi:hypothetical protein